MAQSKKNDLSMYKKKSDLSPVLDEQSLVKPEPEMVKLTKPRQTKPKNVGGRPSPKPEDLRNHKITLNFTEAERKAITLKSGLVPDATFVVHILRENGLFDPE